MEMEMEMKRGYKELWSSWASIWDSTSLLTSLVVYISASSSMALLGPNQRTNFHIFRQPMTMRKS